MNAVTCNLAGTTVHRPLLTSPAPGFEVRAILDQDESLAACLMGNSDGRRAVLLRGTERFRPGQAEEFTRWAQALRDIAAVSQTSEVLTAGATDDGRAYLACLVQPSMADHMRLSGQPEPNRVRLIGALIADALATAHSYGVIHGAVSPATVMFDGDQVVLGGFGVTAPALSTPVGLWAFTAPEHRQSALSGEPAASAGADVFALAATLCVALIGAVPWSQPSDWASAAELPTGVGVPQWVAALRDALRPDPDERPNAEEFAAAMRKPHETVEVACHGARADLRPLLPRRVRRLCAYSIAAMTDAPPAAYGRAEAPISRRSAFTPAPRRVVRPRIGPDAIATSPTPRLPERASAAKSWYDGRVTES